MTPCKVTITHAGKSETYSIRSGLGFQALNTKATTPIEFNCRKADCGICIIRVKEGEGGLTPPNDREKDFLQAMRADPEERLACQCRIVGDVHVEVEF